MDNEAIRKTLLRHFEGHPERWAKGTEVDPSQAGSYLAWSSGECSCLGIVGANLADTSHDVVAKALGFDCASDLYAWNDDPTRTFDEVLSLLRGEAVHG